jgi:hypothetical protein
MTITVNPLSAATITAGSATTFCSGGQVVLTASAGSSYLWSDNETTQSITANASGNYSVIVTNANNCSATSAATSVTVNGLPTASITAGSATTFCAGGEVILTASAGNSYLWSNNATTQSITVNVTGNYSVTVTNANNCSATSAATAVTVNVLPVVTTAKTDVGCLGGNDGSITVTASNGNPPYQYSKDGGANYQSGNVFTGLTAGVYSIVVKSSTNCLSVSQQVVIGTVPDVTRPVPNMANLPVLTGECSVMVSGAPTATDNCSGTIYGTTTDDLSYSTQGTHIIHWSFDDGHGNISTQDQTVIILDVTAPVADVTNLPTKTGECSVTVTAPTATDNCSGMITGTTSDPVEYTAQGTYTIRWIFDDGHHNISVQTQTVIVKDVTAPVVPMLATITGECSATATVPTTKDNCAGTITGTTSDALIYTAQGTYTIHWSFEDGNGNVSTTTQMVMVVDVTPPTIICQTNITATAGSAAGAVVNYTAPVAADNCSVTTVALTAGLPSGSTFPIGITTVTYTVTDVAGLTASCSFDVIVSGLAPVINCPGNISVSSKADLCGAVVNFVAAETRAVPASTITYSIAPGSFFPVGITTVTATATNAVGVSSCSFTVTVTDNQFPVLIGVPANVTVECNAVPVAATVTATDNCATSVPSFTETRTDGGCVGRYALTRTWTTIDASGNRTTATQVITVQDTQAPVTTVAVLPTLTGDCSVTAMAPTATDNCKGAVTGTTTDPLSYSTQGTYTIHWIFDDGNGNTAMQNQNVVISDNTRPTLFTPEAITISCGTSTLPAVTGNATATDNCSAVSINYTDVVNGNMITRSWKATDAAGNHDTNTQIITIVDNIKPTINGISDITVNCGASTLPAATGTPTAIDACSTPTLTYTDVSSGNRITRTWTATDAAGNYNTSTQVITVGTIFSTTIASVPASSVYTGGIATSLYLGYGAQSTVLQVNSLPSSGAPYTYAWNGSYTNKLNSTTSAAPVFTPTAFGYYTFNVAVTNKYGCVSSATISICVTDIRVPGSNGKVYVCHAPPGNPNNKQTLSISVNAVGAHLTLKLESKYETPVNMRVMDGRGRVVDAKSKIGANSTIQIGHNYSSGTYYAELVQGNTRKVVQLIKGRG